MNLNHPRHRNIPRIQKKTLAWSRTNGRKFPWRKTTNPYRVLVAEKLLQQTRAGSSVVKAYAELIKNYPTAKELSSADIRVLKKHIRPLGLIYRANELKRLGKQLTETYNAKVPRQIEALKKLPGVGEYAARSVLVFAFNKRTAIVDTNIARFVYRLFGIPGKLPPNPARSRKILSYAEKLLPKRRYRDFNFALLDLCAKVCQPKTPLCEICPVRSDCSYGQKAKYN